MSNNDLHALFDTIEQQQAEIERLRKELEQVRAGWDGEILVAANFKRELDECHRLLQQYGGHKENCKSYRPAWWWAVPNKCDCGWQNEIATCYVDGGRK